MEQLGPELFGAVVGWITYRTLRRKEGGAAISDLAAVIGAIGGGVVVKLWEGASFNEYSVGLFFGFFAYFVIGLILDRGKADSWMMD